MEPKYGLNWVYKAQISSWYTILFMPKLNVISANLSCRAEQLVHYVHLPYHWNRVGSQNQSIAIYPLNNRQALPLGRN